MGKVVGIGLVVAGLGAAFLAWQLHKIAADPVVRGALASAGKAGAAVDAAAMAGGAVERASDAVSGLADALKDMIPTAKRAPSDAPQWEG